MSMQAHLLRDAFGAFMTGVTVVTCLDEAGKPLGFTANSFASVSLDPPLLLVSISNRSANLAAYSGAKGFAVNILSEGQKDISNTFARPAEDRFKALDWAQGPYGAPVFAGVSAWFDCALEQAFPAGDHTILLGRIEGFSASGAAGLGYYRGSYITPAQTALSAQTGPRVILSALIEHEGAVLLLDDGAGGLALPQAGTGSGDNRSKLMALLDKLGVAAEPSAVYALYDDAEKGC